MLETRSFIDKSTDMSTVGEMQASRLPDYKPNVIKTG